MGEAIQSVLDQTFENWELIVCDDNSSDSSLSIINALQVADSRIQLVPNVFRKGAAGARNSCLECARGRFIAYLDSDDVWLKHKLEVQLRDLQHRGVGFSYSSYTCMSESGLMLHEVKAPRIMNYETLLLSNFIGCLTVVYDTNVFGKVYQPDIRKRNDYALWLTMFRRFPGALAMSVVEPLANYRVNSYGLSSKKLDLIRYYWVCIRRYGGVSWCRAIILTVVYLAITTVKKISPRLYNILVKSEIFL